MTTIPPKAIPTIDITPIAPRTFLAKQPIITAKIPSGIDVQESS